MPQEKNSGQTNRADVHPPHPWTCAAAGLTRFLCVVSALAAILFHPDIVQAQRLSRGFNMRGNILIADQFNNRVIRVSPAGAIVASYGLPLAGGDAIGNNVGYDLKTTQNGLYSPYDAKVIGDYTGLTPPFDFDEDADDSSH